MSLDVYVAMKCDHCGHSEEHGSFNYTYNVGQLWRDALSAVGETKPSRTSAANEAFGEMMGTETGISFGAWLAKAPREDLEKAAWYLGRAITRMYDAARAEK